jgi:hypothetical protein
VDEDGDLAGEEAKGLGRLRVIDLVPYWTSRKWFPLPRVPI